jgi:pimeloyl-ACP methyl ester carboxylesterase/DNA-binding CsgD family transcriptional regulator/PAS domain-containing protein
MNRKRGLPDCRRDRSLCLGRKRDSALFTVQSRMSGPTQPPRSAQFAEREHKAEIVDRIYDVAIDPVRLEDLLDAWEGRAAPLRAGSGSAVTTLDDPDIAAHLDRAWVFLDRYQPADPRGRFRSVLDDLPRTAAFVADGGATVTACNRPARQALGIDEGGPITALPFDPDDIATLRAVIRKVAAGRAEKVMTLRIRSVQTGQVSIMRVGPVSGGDGAPLALVISSELVWPEGFETTVQDAFGLTPAEVDIVRGLTLGQPMKDIAETRGRSLETVRTQVRSILAKTETHGQPELVRVILGLMDVALVPGARPGHTAPAPGLAPLPVQAMSSSGGRRLEWIEFGAPSGVPVIYMPLDYGLVRWPARAEAAARARGLRVVVPFRAWYGGTSPLTRGVPHLDGVTQDYARVMDHLGIRHALAVTQGADLRFAMNLSLKRPDLIRGIVGCAAQLPLRTPAQYERMDKWQRFVLANARYAPKVLPFIVKAGFSLARSLGPEAFFRKVNSGSAADMAAFDDPEIRAAVLAGAGQTLLVPGGTGAEAFSQESLGSERDWSGVARAVTVPVRLLQADQDPQTPVQTVHELMADFPRLEVEFLSFTGQLLLFARWSEVLDAIEAMDARTQGAAAP